MTAAQFQNIIPIVDDRVPVNSTFVITYGEDLDPLTVIVANIIFVDGANNAVPFTVSNTPASQITINPVSNLKNDTLYIITLTSNIFDVKVTPEPIAQKVIKFLTIVLSDIPIINLITDGNPNDVFFEANRVPDLLNFIDIIDNGSKYNFSYVPSFKDNITGLYSHQQVDKLVFNNQSLFESLSRKEMLSTFDDYFETMDSFNILSASDIKKFKKTLMRKSFDINIASGLKNKIQFLIEVFANTSGKYFVDVEADQVDPLIYHISTNMSKEHWNKIIKRIVHPLSWKDVYVEVMQTLFSYFQTDKYHWDQLFLIDDFRGLLALKSPDLFRQIGKTIDGILLTTGIDRELTIPEIRSNHLKGTDQARDFITDIVAYALQSSVTNFVPETERSQVLAVLNNLKTKEKYAFSYLEANRLGSIFSASRLTEDSAGDLQLIIEPGETLPFNFVEVGSDVTFFYDNETNPVLWVTSTEFNDQQYQFGNVNLEIGTGEPVPDPVPENAAISGTTYEIASIDNPVNNIQTIVFTDSITDIILDGDTVVVTGFTIDTNNNGTYAVLTHNKDANSITVPEQEPTAGTAETGGSGIEAEHQRGKEHFPVTFIIPGIFSNDSQLWNGYKIFFDKNKIDFFDTTSRCEFNYNYAEYNASVIYPSIGVGNSLYDAFITELQLPNNRYSNNAKGEFVRFNLTTPNIAWTYGDNIYEFDPDGKTTFWIEKDATISVTNEKMLVKSTTILDGETYQDIITVIGTTYRVSADFISSITSKKGAIEIRNVDNNKLLGIIITAGITPETINKTFVAEETTTRIIVRTKRALNVKFMEGISTGISGTNVNQIRFNKLAFHGTSTAQSGSFALFTIIEETTGHRNRPQQGISAAISTGSGVFGGVGGGGQARNLKGLGIALSTTTSSLDIEGELRSTWDNITVREYIENEEYDPNLLSNSSFLRNKFGKYIGRIEKNISDTYIVNRFLKDITPDAAIQELSGPTYQDYTTEAGNSTINDVQLMAPITPAVNEAFYIGNTDIFSNMYFNIGTAGAGSWTITYKYWNGIIFSDLSGVIDNTDNFRTAGRNSIIFTTPIDWVLTTIDFQGPFYYIKAEITAFSSLSTQPLADFIEVGNHFNTDKYYSNKSHETGVLGTAFDTTTELGVAITEFDRKVTLGLNIPDLSAYNWSITSGTGAETVDLGHEYILMGLKTETYDVLLDIDIDENEITEIVCEPDIGDDLNGVYFTIKSGLDATSYYVWYNTGTPSDPTPGGTGIEVLIDTNESVEGVASKTAFELNAINSSNDFTVVKSTTNATNDTITVTNKVQGTTIDALPNTSTFDVSTTQQGRTNNEPIFTFTGL